MNRLLRACCALAVPLGGLVYAPESVGITYNFTNIADNTTAPIGTFDSFSTPAINGDKVAFSAAYFDPNVFDPQSGIYVGSGGPLITIAKSGDVAPFGSFHPLAFYDARPTISGATAAFLGLYLSSDGEELRRGIFTGSGGPLTLIATQMPVAPFGALSDSELGHPSISDGTIAFRGGTTNDEKGVFIAGAGSLTSIVLTGDPAPIGSFGFTPFEDPATSSGVATFRGYFYGTSGLVAGIFAGGGGPLTTIALKGGSGPIGAFTSLGHPSISDNTIAFAASVDGSAKAGIFVWSGGVLSTLLQLGDPAPSGSFTGFSDVSISGSTIAFFGSYDGRTAILTGSGGSFAEVIARGDPLFGSSVTGLRFGRFGFDPDGTGNIAFAYRLADGRYGIARATLVPEPSSVGHAWLAIVVLHVRVRRLPKRQMRHRVPIGHGFGRRIC